MKNLCRANPVIRDMSTVQVGMTRTNKPDLPLPNVVAVDSVIFAALSCRFVKVTRLSHFIDWLMNQYAFIKRKHLGQYMPTIRANIDQLPGLSITIDNVLVSVMRVNLAFDTRTEITSFPLLVAFTGFFDACH